jgi:hypothetical protein
VLYIEMHDCYLGAGLATATFTSFHSERIKRFRQHLIDLRDYFISNQKNLTNCGKARRDGLRISSVPAESGMNHLDDRLEQLFREWFPRFRATTPMTSDLAA